MKKNDNSKQSTSSNTNKSNNKSNDNQVTNKKSNNINNKKNNVGFVTDNANSLKLDPDNDNSFDVTDCR